MGPVVQLTRSRIILFRRKGFLALVAALSVGALIGGPAVTAANASTASGPLGGTIQNYQTLGCLDSNYNGGVYTGLISGPLHPCTVGDGFQVWSFGGQGPAQTIKDEDTGRCLDSNSAGDVYTSPCNWNNTYQNWNTYYNGPYAAQLQDYQTGRCLDSNYAGDVYTSPCNWNNTYQNWYRN